MTTIHLPPLDQTRMEPTPFPLFARWFKEAEAAHLMEPAAMTLATCTPEGVLSARMVLLRRFDERGFCFFTNYSSRKGDELASNPRAALVLFWASLQRQIRIEGVVEKTSAAESDEYFFSRPRGHRLGAWASPQSQVIANREQLEQRMEEIDQRFQGLDVPRPETWGGYRVVPEMVEFWQGGENRLHDRLRYRRFSAEGWILERLAP